MPTVRQLNVKLSAKQHETLRRHAARRRTPVAWLIKDYIATLVDDEEAERVRRHEPTQAAARGGSFAWLADEPDLYAATDGEPFPTRAPRQR
ncbi:MAG: ribbon-helix-helix protein, CopG family [Actinobacteria bacterium]|nr:MAG: ribbon-helix-helix protein, CopG family [Actinomycetota bacterium]